jgi:SAM-dependent methyltransferase
MTLTSAGNGARRVVLNAGSGVRDGRRLPPPFDGEHWAEVTLDIDPAVRPDYVASLTNMHDVLRDESVDAVWSSHSLEHLYGFELVDALKEFRRVLKPDGFVFATCPDVESVAAAIAIHGLDHVAYEAPVGPITLHDILYGHSASIQAGMTAMAHRTGLTARRLGELALEAGFAEVMVGRGNIYDLWAVFVMPATDLDTLGDALSRTEANFLFADRGGEGRP